MAIATRSDRTAPTSNGGGEASVEAEKDEVAEASFTDQRGNGDETDSRNRREPYAGQDHGQR